MNDLISAAEKDNAASVASLIERGTYVNVRDSWGETPLMHAVLYDNDTDVIELLVNKGADLNVQNGSGWTPLMCAIRNRNIDILKLLLDKGADISIKNNKGQTAIDVIKEKMNECKKNSREYKKYNILLNNLK